MSVRKHGAVVVSIPGERSAPVSLHVSWTTRADRSQAVKQAVGNWARGPRGWWGVYVDVTKLDMEGIGAVYINDNREVAQAQFRVNEKGASTPPPVPAYAVTGGRR